MTTLNICGFDSVCWG